MPSGVEMITVAHGKPSEVREKASANLLFQKKESSIADFSVCSSLGGELIRLDFYKKNEEDEIVLIAVAGSYRIFLDRSRVTCDLP